VRRRRLIARDSPGAGPLAPASINYVPEARPNPPPYLHKRGTPTADTTAAVDVSELLARLAERTEELAEAKVEQKHAEAELRKRSRQLTTERKAHNDLREPLESDCEALESECELLLAESRELEAEVAREEEARTTAEVDLKRAEHMTATLEEKLKTVWAQLRQSETEAIE
jgi:chromosome segregation ATPase